MKVTRVSVKLNRNQNTRVKAFCKVVFDDCFMVNNIVVIKDDRREDYYFVNYPTKVISVDKKIDIVYPLTKEFSKYVENAVLDEFERVLNEAYNNRDYSLAEDMEAKHV